MATRFGAADAHYPPSGGGHAALVVSGEPEFGAIDERATAWLEEVAEYVPGDSSIDLPAPCLPGAATSR
ncbi:hypothetical protein [Nocardioides albus]|uniref:Uncharacterized protein n=1 Tax=Nocardioides albus TaxID=1841 RepID=A0A7W5A8X9_9ACTN|nr:hypothetical protein [Nocardioides albus]MBB3091747.1 hypothetical protein [Nocardioides albus]